MAASYAEGWQNDLMTPFLGLTRDNNLRPDLTLEKLASLKPAFEKSAKGTMTAGNSTPLTDGASLVLLGSEDWAKARGCRSWRTCATVKQPRWISSMAPKGY